MSLDLTATMGQGPHLWRRADRRLFGPLGPKSARVGKRTHGSWHPAFSP